MKILFTGGGTGGHIFPIIAIVRELRKLSNDFEFFYIGPRDDFASEVLEKEKIKTKWIKAGKIRRYIGVKSFFKNIYDLFVKTPIGFFQSFFYIFFLNPDLIFSKGGYGSIPPVLAGWFLGTPVFLHESDSIAGFANKFLARFAIKIFTSFPETENLPKEKIIFSGNPVRQGIFGYSKEDGIKILKLQGKKPVILILGGSQGAQRINDKILEILNQLATNFEIIHQTGKRNFKEFTIEAELLLKKELKPFYHPFSFLEEKELGAAYGAADLIISRAGAGAIFEISALGKPSILVPLPESAQGHQFKNAYLFAQNGASIVMEEENFTPHFLFETIKSLFEKPEKLKKMGEKAKEFCQKNSAEFIAKCLFYFLTQP